MAISSEVLPCDFNDHGPFKNVEDYDIINILEATDTMIESNVVQPPKEAGSAEGSKGK